MNRHPLERFLASYIDKQGNWKLGVGNLSWTQFVEKMIRTPSSLQIESSSDFQVRTPSSLQIEASPHMEWTLGSNTYTLPTLHQVNNLNKDSEYICESCQYCFAESSSIFTFLLYVVTIVTSYPFSIVWCFEPYKLNVYFLNVFFCHYPLNSWSHPPLSHHAQVWHSCSHGDIWKRQRLYYQQVLSLLIILVCLNGWWSEGFWIICSG